MEKEKPMTIPEILEDMDNRVKQLEEAFKKLKEKIKDE